jgi:ubiquinone/menaquinone biosynthesis C-methylase UbiE
VSTEARGRGHRGAHAEFTAAVARAYDRTGSAWSGGPALVYDPMADALVAQSPVPLGGRTVVDVGAGTGAASLAVAAAGGRVVAVDLALGMLRANRADRASVAGGVVADAVTLPLADRAVDGLVAAFSFNHLPEPAAGFREAARVCRPGSPVLVAAYAAEDDHPAKQAVEQAAAESGWQPEPWHTALRVAVSTHLATVEGMLAAATAAEVAGVARTLVVDLPDLAPDAMVGWRMGMAQMAPFLATVDVATRRGIALRALALLGPAPPSVRRSIIVFAGTA